MGSSKRSWVTPAYAHAGYGDVLQRLAWLPASKG
jgi:hypothetical protein